MDAICGTAGTNLWIEKTLSPCFFETGAAVCALLVLLPTLLAQTRRIALHNVAISKAGVTGCEGGFIALSGFVLVVHAVHLAASLLISDIQRLPFHAVYHATLLCCWLVVLLMSIRATRSHMPLDFRPYCLVLMLVYLYSMVVFFMLYNSYMNEDTKAALYPLSYIKSGTWTALLQTMASLGMLTIDSSMQLGIKVTPNDGFPWNAEDGFIDASGNQGRLARIRDG
eukprot:gene28994-32186_t